MRFLLEETSWGWDGTERDAYVERVEQILDRLDVAREREEPYAGSSLLLTQAILGAHTLADLLWNRDSPLHLPPEVSERIAPHFGAMTYWDDETPWPAVDVKLAGRDVFSPSIALAHARVTRGEATACIPLPGSWSGPLDVVVDQVGTPVHFVVDERSHRAFFRDAIEVERADEDGVAALAPHAFPDLLVPGWRVGRRETLRWRLCARAAGPPPVPRGPRRSRGLGVHRHDGAALP